jgi:hypothetical protein
LAADKELLSQLLLHQICCCFRLQRAAAARPFAVALCAVDPSCLLAWAAVSEALEHFSDSGLLKEAAAWFWMEGQRRCNGASRPPSPMLAALVTSYGSFMSESLQKRWAALLIKAATPDDETSGVGAHGQAALGAAAATCQRAAAVAVRLPPLATADPCDLLRQAELAVMKEDWSTALLASQRALLSPLLSARSVLLTNAAQCHSKLAHGQVDRVLAATAAAVLNPASAKTLLRQAEALLALQLVQEAKHACAVGLQTPWSEQAAKEELLLLQRSLATLEGAQMPAFSAHAGSFPRARRAGKFSKDVCPADETEAEYMQQLRAMRELHAVFDQSFGIEQQVRALDPLKRASVPAFDEEAASGAWFAGADAHRCRQIVEGAREKAGLQFFDEIDAAETDMEKLWKSIEEHVPTRLGCLMEERFRWWATAPSGAVRFVHDDADGQKEPIRQCLSFPNHPFRPMIFAAGKTNVLTGTRHVDLTSLCYAEDVSTHAGSPTHFVGFGPHAACVAKSLIIIHLLSTPRAVDARSAVIDAVLEIWYSSTLQPSSAQHLRTAITALLERHQAGKHPLQLAVVALLRQWLVRHVSLQEARQLWLDGRPLKSVAAAANLKERVDRVAYCHYVLSGDVLPSTSASTGNPCMHVLPDGWHRAQDETIFDRIGAPLLLQKRMRSANIVLAVTAFLRDEIRRLHDLLSSGTVRADFRLSSLLEDRAASVRAIHSLQPWCIYWSNACDHMRPKEFHALARACSADEDTIHFALSLNWTRDVKGSWLFDFADASQRMEFIRLARSYHARLHEHGRLNDSDLPTAVGATFPVPPCTFLLPARDHLMNLCTPVLASHCKVPWREAFFHPRLAGGYVNAPSGSFEQGLYSALASRSTHLWFTFTYDPTVRMEAPQGLALCVNPRCVSRSIEEPSKELHCKRCWSAVYCSDACQRQDAAAHAPLCHDALPL